MEGSEREQSGGEERGEEGGEREEEEVEEPQIQEVVADTPEPAPTAPKKKRTPAEKYPCGKCGRMYSLRRLENHKCVPPTFPSEGEDKENEDPEPPVKESDPHPASPPEPERPPPNSLKAPAFDLDALTPDIISSLIRKDREAKRAARRERWSQQLF